jgi:hypothetical protein
MQANSIDKQIIMGNTCVPHLARVQSCYSLQKHLDNQIIFQKIFFTEYNKMQRSALSYTFSLHRTGGPNCKKTAVATQ